MSRARRLLRRLLRIQSPSELFFDPYGPVAEFALRDLAVYHRAAIEIQEALNK